MGASDQAIATAQRALALATTDGDIVLHAQAKPNPGPRLRGPGRYRRAIDCLGQTVAAIDGARRHELLGDTILPAVSA